MRKSRRQIALRIIEAVGLGLVVLVLVVYFAVYKPLGEKLDDEVRGNDKLRLAVRNEQRRVDQLQKYLEAFPQTGKGLQEFTIHRIPARREAYSTAAHLIHKLADASGVQLTTTVYRLEKERQDPLEKLSVEINVQGPYASLMKFSHALETADNLVLVRDFTITPGGQSGTLGLRLGAEVYLTP